MRVGVSSERDKLESKVSKVFGRAPFFIIAEVENGKIMDWRAVENVNTERLGNVGVLSAKKIADEGVDVLITGNVGPRASQVFEQFSIKVLKKSGVVKTVLENL